MKKKIDRVFKLTVAFSILFIVATFCQKKTDGFTIARILSNRPFNNAWQIRPLTDSEEEQISQALAQLYTYYGKGGQSYIFFSQDGQYVIKFFKQRVFNMPLWLDYFPLPGLISHYRDKKRWHKQDKLNRDFTSYKLAFEELAAETGIIFVHLNKTENIGKLTIVDRLNIHHSLDLNQFDFVIQKKGELVFDRINRLMKEEKRDEAKESISQVVELIYTRCKKGYYDRDPNIRTNCGFIQGKAIKIDVGRLGKDERMKDEEIAMKEVRKICGPFKDWLKENHPTLVSHLEKEMDAK